MAANRRRGEVSAVIGGEERRLCLTLGALAELEDAFALEDLGQLAARFGSGHLSARDLTRILGAGLRGAGACVSDAELANLPIEGGVAGAARVAAELLDAAFGGAGGETPARP
ncbi:gene transfer agent family protein [Aureimonas sp. AU4]|uniref:gene transfer agent family protein n=1 Tax=Aureimonas sp. AU4 TaxID=1638163 RepID=UPI000784B8A0|nr:gene transfer agent family protein [Aureimonas sp. AU4]